MSSAPSPTRLAKLAELTASLFHNVYNPTGARTGNRILRERLKGPTFQKYYPPALIKFRDVKAAFPDMQLVDIYEEQRLEEIEKRRRRGKGAPKKGQGRRATITKKK
ncbi:mitochondrial 37S ribosomal protein mS33 [Calcarisporiella thermophila]|uniref:mitochondrial 37S ribosomal protein mS33 n=1 Tax=Calcarisporiella thermophila TaxID=911321 RepID=UPI0037425272